MYQTAVLLWMHDPATRDAVVLRQSLSGDFINLEAATEIICSRTSTQIQTIKQIYHSMFGAYVEHDVAIQASGDHEKVNCRYCPSLYVKVQFIVVIFRKYSIIWAKDFSLAEISIVVQK